MEIKEIIIKNKRASHDFFIEDTYECGIVLTGTEIKSIRLKKVSINESYCHIKNDELFVVNMNVSKYDKGNIFNHDETRNRKLLVHKSEIRKIKAKTTKEGYTLIPLTLYLINGKAKLEIGICKGKKNYDKRETLKNEALKREVAKAMKR